VRDISPKFSLGDPRLKVLCENKILPDTPASDILIPGIEKTLRRFPKYNSVNLQLSFNSYYKDLPNNPKEFNSVEYYKEYLLNLLD